MLPMQGALVYSLVGEQRSHMLCHTAKFKKSMVLEVHNEVCRRQYLGHGIYF